MWTAWEGRPTRNIRYGNLESALEEAITHPLPLPMRIILQWTARFGAQVSKQIAQLLIGERVQQALRHPNLSVHGLRDKRADGGTADTVAESGVSVEWRRVRAVTETATGCSGCSCGLRMWGDDRLGGGELLH